MTTSDEELERLDTKIRSLAQAFLAAGRPYLLSRLGKDLGDDLKLVKFGYGRTLGDYVAERLAAEYSVILMGQHKNVQAIVPNNGSALGIGQSVTPEGMRGPRYNYRFWAAFSVPLIEGSRWLNLDDFTFKDVREKPDGNYIEIKSDLVAHEDAEDRDALIKSNISKWLDSEGLSQERFIAKPQVGDGKESAIPIGRTLLEAVIQALDRKQLSATTLSLDVVADLLRRRL
ncbi:hypothetical protein NKJ46_18460 [Mesorhizobium sp. M0166]|uniref:hypothetical protein n=1 Tax=Mesorhizobium sp. M0166 TaxID=2956902 RepID=UPI00333D1610